MFRYCKLKTTNTILIFEIFLTFLSCMYQFLIGIFEEIEFCLRCKRFKSFSNVHIFANFSTFHVILFVFLAGIAV